MAKFAFLLDSSYPERIAGDEDGNLIVVTPNKLSDKQWINENLSTKLKVFDLKGKGVFHYNPSEMKIEKNLELQIERIILSKFEITINFFFSKSAMVYVIQDMISLPV